MEEYEIVEQALTSVYDSIRIQCPLCGPTRKKKHEKTMSVTIDGDTKLYMCHHCNIKGAIKAKRDYYQTRRQPNVTTNQANVVPIDSLTNDEQIVKKFLAKRNIDPSVLDHYTVIGGQRFYPGAAQQLESVGFVYEQDQGRAIKWRSIDGKYFSQDGAAGTLWGLSSATDTDTLYICEGEADALALASVGYHGLSVPCGAPNPAANSFDSHKRFQFIAYAADTIDKASKVVVIGDQDAPGQALVSELCRRLGHAKCYTVKLPQDCKDPNDVLIKHGPDKLKEVISQASPVPLKGVYTIDDYSDDIDKIYQKGLGRGESTGIASVDELFTIAPGQLSVVTGLPGSGKSEFVDQIICNLAANQGWKIAICSFENPPPLHAAKLAEKYTGKPFFSGYQSRQTQQELDNAKQFIRDHFCFLDQRDGDPASMESIIDRATQAVMRFGVQGLVIDPYNFVENSKSDQEHLGISAMLTKLLAFAKSTNVHVWFIAHPAKMYASYDGTPPIPNGNHISGSAAWFAKADVGITVHRPGIPGEAEIHCWKVRFKWIGKVGSTCLDYNISNGIYADQMRGYPSTAATTGTTTNIRAPKHYLDDIEDDDLEF